MRLNRIDILKEPRLIELSLTKYPNMTPPSNLPWQRESDDYEVLYTYCVQEGLQHWPPLGVPQTGPTCAVKNCTA